MTDEFLAIVNNPVHGYGSNMNPCIDCRILLYKKAKDLMQQEKASFIISGEVLGQRPMSQQRHTLNLIEKEAGLKGLVVRPLSAKLLDPTIPEQEGWIDREKLLAIGGRGRKEQLQLAKTMGINDYPCPSGGCLLTDPEFSRRVKDLILQKALDRAQVMLLRLGRHFRLDVHTKLVVGRNEEENNQLASLAKNGDYLFFPPDDVAGPTALGRGEFSAGLITLSGRILARYFDSKDKTAATVLYKKVPEEGSTLFSVVPLDEERLTALRI